MLFNFIKVKQAIITILCVFLFADCLSAQAEKPDTTEIQKEVKEIKENINSYEKIEKIKTSTDEKCVFYKDKEIKLITIRTLDKGTEKNAVWFYSKGQLIYTEQYWLDKTTKKIVDNEKCYLRKGQLIAWVNAENKLVDNSSSEFKTLESSLNKFGPKWYGESAK